MAGQQARQFILLRHGCRADRPRARRRGLLRNHATDGCVGSRHLERGRARHWRVADISVPAPLEIRLERQLRYCASRAVKAHRYFDLPIIDSNRAKLRIILDHTIRQFDITNDKTIIPCKPELELIHIEVITGLGCETNQGGIGAVANGFIDKRFFGLQRRPFFLAQDRIGLVQS